MFIRIITGRERAMGGGRRAKNRRRRRREGRRRCRGRRRVAAASGRLKPTAALEGIFRKLNVKMSWNTSRDPCTGPAVDPGVKIESTINPLVKCDCSFDTFCHVTQLKINEFSARGQIPEELKNLTYLNNLDLRKNCLTGSLPPFIGNLTKMQYMSFGTNFLSGTIPKEFGNLVELISLSVSTNNFSGPLPPQLGNLVKLQKLYVSSSGVGGEIPPSLAKLVNLNILWASGNNFTGQIPEFIGKLTNLTVLRFQGNAFHGPIPLSFANLINLQDLRIGDIINGSSSMSFIRNMTSLSTLILRNAKISGAIPTDIAELTSLQLLDLSFNNLTGTIPPSLFNMNQLKFLFLGNNSFSGGLPLQKTGALGTIDLSYNNLSGAFPTWITEDKLHLNLVANNFMLTSSNNSILSQGLECLQKDIPCNRGSPNWYNFAINCGGTKSIDASDKLHYDQDNESMYEASYYVTPQKRWAVSNVGKFVDASNSSFVEYSFSQFSNTLDTELFQSSRLSPSSLRYYGLGLENGNYTTKLQFVERAFPDGADWRGIGKRVFDIYIQGELKEKDFDIKKTAGGKSDVVVIKEYTTKVAENFLEIHLFWAGKGTCCVPTQGYYGPSISAISVTPNFVPTVRNQPETAGSSQSWRKTSIIVLAVSIPVIIILLICLFVIRRRKKANPTEEYPESWDLDAKLETFSYAELVKATDNFSAVNKLGEGGFGEVFKGSLSDGRAVAVKQLSVTPDQGKREILAEIAIITAVQHKNLAKLYGSCFEGSNRLLVYEFLENKSLDQALFGRNKLDLDWTSRFNICLGTAKGLAYLHEDSAVRIVHRDVKASNILLDGDLHPKISDFGLAKFYDVNKTHISTRRIAGTFGYLAPEYALRGLLTEKADIFSFGVVALEIVSGRPNTDPLLNNERMYLVEWVWQLYEDNAELKLMDPTLTSYNEEEAIRIIKIALLCTQASPAVRPSMSKVVSMLAGEVPLSEIKSKPTYFKALYSENVDTSSMFTDDATSSFTQTSHTYTGSVSPAEDSLLKVSMGTQHDYA